MNNKKGLVEEWCSNCGQEVLIEAKMEKQICPNCQKPIKPCVICYTENTKCSDCPL